ncbi:unnamed protein product [Didymodactylos carnosus]|uniref:RRM domain-containing protein n=1 Tax=Didymodactylos carnosus TaxID=1234261 RepID=A0A813RLX2_9BILA|nr:unnamed protein product [Didymodactylos carnosus]CAF0786130.1 unnamed protein product [Didymodactylos carnosus]CAF3505241.1 unnamed protein product [Didymodactylos carnosus]CAF3569885.1 unnamed protein product [Didymodactylos carnosus]
MSVFQRFNTIIWKPLRIVSFLQQKMSSHYTPRDNMKDQRTLYCGNLHENVTEELLFELFLQSGPLEDVRLKRDGRRAFAFITFKHEESVPYAEAIMENVHLFNRPLRLNPRANANTSNNTNNSYSGLDSSPMTPLLQNPMQRQFSMPPFMPSSVNNNFGFNAAAQQVNFSTLMPPPIQHQQFSSLNSSTITNYKLSQNDDDEPRHSTPRQSRRDNRSYHPYRQQQQQSHSEDDGFSHRSKNQHTNYALSTVLAMKRKRQDSSTSINSNTNESVSNKISRLQIGTSVRAQLDDSKWYTGTIFQCQLRKYLVQFSHLKSEESQQWIDFENIRLIPKEKRPGTSSRQNAAFEYRPGQFIRNDTKTANVSVPIGLKSSASPAIVSPLPINHHCTSILSTESPISSIEIPKSSLLSQRNRTESDSSSKGSIESSQESTLKQIEYSQRNPVENEDETYYLPSERVSLSDRYPTKKSAERSSSNEKSSGRKPDQSEIVIFRPIIRFIDTKSRTLSSSSQSKDRPKRPRVNSKLSIDLTSQLSPTRHPHIRKDRKLIPVHDKQEEKKIVQNQKQQEKNEITEKTFAVQEEVVSSTSQQELSPLSISVEQDDDVSRNTLESDQHLFDDDEDINVIQALIDTNLNVLLDDSQSVTNSVNKDEDLPSTTTTISQSHFYNFHEDDLIYPTDSHSPTSTDIPYVVHQVEGAITSSTANDELIEAQGFLQTEDKSEAEPITETNLAPLLQRQQNSEHLLHVPQHDRQKSKRKQHRPQRVTESDELQRREAIEEQVPAINIDKPIQRQRQGKRIRSVLGKLRQKPPEEKPEKCSTRKSSNKSVTVKLEPMDVIIQTPSSISSSTEIKEEELPVQTTSSFNWELTISPKRQQQSKMKTLGSTKKNDMVVEQTNQSESFVDENAYLSDEYEDPETWVVDGSHNLLKIHNDTLKNNLIHPTQIQLTRVELKQILNRLQNIYMTLQEKMTTKTTISPSTSDEEDECRQRDLLIETDFFDREKFMLTKYLKHVDKWLKNDFERYDLLETYRKMVYSDSNNDNSNDVTHQTFVEQLHLLGDILKFIFCVFFKNTTEQMTYTKSSMKSFKQHINHMPDEIKYHIKTCLKQIIEIDRQQQENRVQNTSEKLTTFTFVHEPLSSSTSIRDLSKRSLNSKSKLSMTRSKAKIPIPRLTVPPITIRRQRLIAPRSSTQLEPKSILPVVMNVMESSRSPSTIETSSSPLQSLDASNSDVASIEDESNMLRTTKSKRQIKIRKPTAFLNTNEHLKSQTPLVLQTNSISEISPLKISNQNDKSPLTDDIIQYISPKKTILSPLSLIEVVDSAPQTTVETILTSPSTLTVPTTTIAIITDEISPDSMLLTENDDTSDVVVEELRKKQHKEERDIYEVIHCICGVEIDNGFMIQCETCLCWSHCTCVGVTETYVPAVFKCFVCTKSQSECTQQWTVDSIDVNDNCSFLTTIETSNEMSIYFDCIKPLYDIRERIMSLKLTYQPILKCLHNALGSDDLFKIFKYANIRHEHISDHIQRREENKFFYKDIASCLNNVIACVCDEKQSQQKTNGIINFVDHLSSSQSSSSCVSIDLCPDEIKLENVNQQDMIILPENLKLFIIYMCDDSDTQLARLSIKTRYNELLTNLQDKIQTSLDEYKDIQKQIETKLGILYDDNDIEENNIQMLQTMYTNHENDLKILIERLKY